MAAKKEAKTRARARGKAQREAEREVRAKARQKTIRYAADGTRIGDDGLPMTKARTRLHNLYNACFIVMCVSFIGAAVCIGLSYFQGQRLSEWELIAYGGNQFNGLSIATLLCIEALYLLFVTAISLFANMKGMAWLYDKASIKPVKATMGAMGVVSVVYFIVALFAADVPEPVSAVMVVISILMMRFVAAVDSEKGTLRPVKVARTVIKK